MPIRLFKFTLSKWLSLDVLSFNVVILTISVQLTVVGLCRNGYALPLDGGIINSPLGL